MYQQKLSGTQNIVDAIDFLLPDGLSNMVRRMYCDFNIFRIPAAGRRQFWGKNGVA